MDVFNFYIYEDVKLLARLHLSLSQHCEHKLKQVFQRFLNPLFFAFFFNTPCFSSIPPVFELKYADCQTSSELPRLLLKKAVTDT